MEAGVFFSDQDPVLISYLLSLISCSSTPLYLIIALSLHTAGSVAKLRLYFQGHYDEPYLDMEVPLKDGQTEVYNLKYKPGAAEWEVEKH